MGYEKKDIEAKIIEAGADSLYSSKIVNYAGYFSGSKERYTEYIAKYLIDHPDYFRNIKNARRDKYKTDTHVSSEELSNKITEFINDRKNREEEWIAKKIFSKQIINGIGEIIDYQTPLKVPGAGKRNSGLGKIDLLSYNEGNITILELKKPKTPETLLRCVLEAYTYYRIMENNLDILINQENFNLPDKTKLRKAVLVFDGEESRPYEEYMNKKYENNYVLELMKKLDVDFYAIDNELFEKEREFMVRKL